MCGIVGQIGTPSPEARRLQGLLNLQHRGPDDNDQWMSMDSHVWIAQRRLSINDLTVAGRQPMVNETQTIHMICNGEIYNYPTLRQELEKRGHRFSSNSDSESILHAYEEWGDAVVEHLEGMFAFALWDDDQKRLLLARDHVGIKPMLYSPSTDGLCFSSEAGGILPLLPQRPELEPLALSYILTVGYVPAPYTMWQTIYQLEPGHILTWCASEGIRTRQYWEPPHQVDDGASYDLEEWTALFERVVEEHLLSDVPLGLFLSGGLDSSSVALALNHLNQTQISTFTLDFVGHKASENPIAQQVAQNLGFDHNVIPFCAEDALSLVRAVACTHDTPHGGSAQTTMLSISKAVARTHKVVLSGDGGDEVFGGYTRYHNLFPIEYAQQSPYQRLRSGARKVMSPVLGKKPFHLRSNLHRHLWRTFPRYLPEEAETLLAPMGVIFSEEEMLAPFEKHFVDTMPLQRALQRVDLMTYCVDSILNKVDRGSMAHSLEVRVPLLDHRIIEWGLKRPLDPRESILPKPILHDYLKAGNVPQDVLEHPKQGFSVRGLEDFDWDTVPDIIERGALVQEGYLRPDFRDMLSPDHQYHTARLWSLLMLTYWAESWLR